MSIPTSPVVDAHRSNCLDLDPIGGVFQSILHQRSWVDVHDHFGGGPTRFCPGDPTGSAVERSSISSFQQNVIAKASAKLREGSWCWPEDLDCPRSILIELFSQVFCRLK